MNAANTTGAMPADPQPQPSTSHPAFGRILFAIAVVVGVYLVALAFIDADAYFRHIREDGRAGAQPDRRRVARCAGCS